MKNEALTDAELGIDDHAVAGPAVPQINEWEGDGVRAQEYLERIGYDDRSPTALGDLIALLAATRRDLETALLEALTVLGQISARDSQHRTEIRNAAIARGWKALGR